MCFIFLCHVCHIYFIFYFHLLRAKNIPKILKISQSYLYGNKKYGYLYGNKKYGRWQDMKNFITMIKFDIIASTILDLFVDFFTQLTQHSFSSPQVKWN